MFKEILQHPFFFIGSILLHVVLAALLLFSFDYQNPMPVPEKVSVVQAMVVDEAKVQQAMRELDAAEEKKRQDLADNQKRLDDQERRAEEAKRKRQAEERRLKEAEAKRKREQQAVLQAEQKRKIEEQAKLKAEAEKRRSQEAQKQAEQAKAKADAERKRLQEAQRQAELAKQKAEDDARKAEEAKLQAEREKRRIEEQRLQEEAAVRRAAEADRMRQQLEAEQQALAAERTRKVQSEVDRYQLLIKQKVMSKWLRPVGSSEGLRCVVRVKIAPGGLVLVAEVVESSGNPIFDRSVEVAVRSAEPLPLPADASMFEQFREIRFVFEPKE